MSQISEDARKMRDYIIEHDWTQGQKQSDQGEVCLIGAQMLSGAGFNTRSGIRELLGNIGIVDWNDDPNRTKQEVLDMLENVAIKYDDDAYTSGANNDTA